MNTYFLRFSAIVQYGRTRGNTNPLISREAKIVSAIITALHSHEFVVAQVGVVVRRHYGEWAWRYGNERFIDGAVENWPMPDGIYDGAVKFIKVLDKVNDCKKPGGEAKLLKHGTGVLRSKDGGVVIYSGQWKADKRDGEQT